MAKLNTKQGQNFGKLTVGERYYNIYLSVSKSDKYE